MTDGHLFKTHIADRLTMLQSVFVTSVGTLIVRRGRSPLPGIGTASRSVFLLCNVSPGAYPREHGGLILRFSSHPTPINIAIARSGMASRQRKPLRIR
jgi:hypothetical protein